METKFDQEVNAYMGKIADYNAHKIAKEKLKILQKLQKVEYVDLNGNVCKRDITNLPNAQAKIKLRYKLLENSKRISGVFKMQNIDYNLGWSMINRTFINPNKGNQRNMFLENLNSQGFNFMDTLTLEALKQYGAYLTDIYDMAYFGRRNLSYSAYNARINNVDVSSDEMFANYFLPKNWKIIYKYIRQLEMLTAKEKSFQNSVNDLAREN